MKNTLMFLLVSLLLAFSLTACGGNGQNGGYGADTRYNSSTSSDYNSGSNSNYRTGGGSGYSTGRSSTNGSLMNGARDAMDDAGRAVRNTMDDIERAM